MKKLIYILGIIPLGAMAQQSLDESIAVEGKYAADIIHLERISSYPEAYPIELPRTPLEYDLEPLNSTFRPSFYPIGLPMSGKESPRGYADLSIGSWLDTHLDAAAWILPEREANEWRLGVWLGHRGTSLWRWKHEGQETARRRDYDQNVGAILGRRLKNRQDITMTTDYRVHYFNYFMAPGAPSQTLNSFNADIAWKSAPEAKIEHQLQGHYNHFAFRSVPLSSSPANAIPSRENVVSVSGYVCKSEKSRDYNRNGGIGLSESGMRLSGNLTGVFSPDYTYGMLTLTPSYTAKWMGCSLEAGANVDFSMKAGDPSEPFSAIHVSPAIVVLYPRETYTFFAKILGGTDVKTLERRAEMSIWNKPYLSPHCPLYTPINASVGINAGPSSGFLRGLYGGFSVRWKAVDHVSRSGWYPEALIIGGEEGEKILGTESGLIALHGVGIEGKLGWSYRKIMEAELNLSYTPQHRSRGIFNGVDRPRWIGDIKTGVRPTERLRLGLGATWRGVRKLWKALGGDERIPDWFTLDMDGTWKLDDAFEIGAGVYNLTNRRNYEIPGVATEGIVFMGRLIYRF